MRITESQLRRIVREEASRLREGKFSYRKKLDLIQDAIDSLDAARALEADSDMGSDPDLDGILESLVGLASAVEVMAQEEDEVSDPFQLPRRAMRP